MKGGALTGRRTHSRAHAQRGGYGNYRPDRGGLAGDRGGLAGGEGDLAQATRGEHTHPVTPQ